MNLPTTTELLACLFIPLACWLVFLLAEVLRAAREALMAYKAAEEARRAYWEEDDEEQEDDDDEDDDANWWKGTK